MTENLTQGSDEWIEARTWMLTASNFAAAMGLNPYTSRQKLYRQLVGEEPAFEGNEMTEYGVEHEPDAIYAYEAHSGEFVTPTGFWVHPKIDYLGASPDGLVTDAGLIECKCKFSGELWDIVPDHYMAQIQGQLEITGRIWCDFVSWSPDGLSIQRVEYSPDYWDAALPLLEKFWTEVIDRHPPKRAKKPVMPFVPTLRIL